MGTVKWIIFMSSLTLLLTTGCAMNRANVTLLSEAQQTYYTDLNTALKQNRNTLKNGLNEQIEADRIRDLNLVDWERDLQKAEVLLQVNANVTGNQKLLSMKLAELNLEAVNNLSGNKIDDSRKKAILKLYDNLIKAVESLEKNNAQIVKFLGSGNEEFALRNLDVDGLVYMVSTIRSLQEELGQIEKRSEEKREKESERTQRAIERSRDLLVKVFEQ